MRTVAIILASAFLSAGAEAQPVTKKPTVTPAFYPPQVFERVVPKGEARTVLFASMVNPDCSSQGAIVPRLNRKPQHGSIRFEEGENFSTFSASDYAHCSKQKVQGVAVIYEPDVGFEGSDNVVATMLYPNGRARRVELRISVQ
jgi:hypothetical protein